MVDELNSTNGRKRPISASNQRRVVDPDVVPPSGQRSTPPAHDSMIVFYGDAQQVRDGFVLALDAMESNADSLIMSTESVPERN